MVKLLSMVMEVVVEQSRSRGGRHDLPRKPMTRFGDPRHVWSTVARYGAPTFREFVRQLQWL
jgi:hypothetical protein